MSSIKYTLELKFQIVYWSAKDLLTDRLGGKEAWRPTHFILPAFFSFFQMNFAMATLGLKEMEKFLQT